MSIVLAKMRPCDVGNKHWFIAQLENVDYNNINGFASKTCLSEQP